MIVFYLSLSPFPLYLNAKVHFETILSRIISTIYFSVCLSLVYKKAADICMLILYHAICCKHLSIKRVFNVLERDG